MAGRNPQVQFVDPDLSAISAAVTALEELSLNKDRTRWVIKHVGNYKEVGKMRFILTSCSC